MTEGILSRLVRAQLTKGPKVKGKDIYKLRIDNASPLILNGIGVKGAAGQEGDPVRELSGICIAPRHSFTVPVSEGVVKLLELKKGTSGVRVIAADLSGL